MSGGGYDTRPHQQVSNAMPPRAPPSATNQASTATAIEAKGNGLREANEAADAARSSAARRRRATPIVVAGQCSVPRGRPRRLRASVERPPSLPGPSLGGYAAPRREAFSALRPIAGVSPLGGSTPRLPQPARLRLGPQARHAGDQGLLHRRAPVGRSSLAKDRVDLPGRYAGSVNFNALFGRPLIRQRAIGKVSEGRLGFRSRAA
jgi:hypothetical protein